MSPVDAELTYAQNSIFTELAALRDLETRLSDSNWSTSEDLLNKDHVAGQIYFHADVLERMTRNFMMLLRGVKF